MLLQTSQHYASVCAFYLALESQDRRKRRFSNIKHYRKQYHKYHSLLYKAVYEKNPTGVGA
ncbi:hypothetical protein [Paenibacillus polymyxa]|uniref:Uncharacterized protein n=1 Tax=Paenibacillus polymyxa TaxID=1406 RepID=A0ABX2ZCH0_PAEPO|nr:hypothetical protein [Paenibacillus polymyxa]ODA08703.1 hypothetical protein A7312_04675 [Paenibacillus polymyxa]